MTEGRPGAAILTGSALVALWFLSSSDRLALSLLRNRAQAEAALGKSTPWSNLARNARTEEAWSADEEREGRRDRRIRASETRLGDAEETRRANGFLGNTKLRSEAASKALGRGILVGVVGQQVERLARMRDKMPRPSAECNNERSNRCFSLSKTDDKEERK